MGIYDNAISSIVLALEDFSTGEPERLLSAVRNLHSGILLLYKAKLSSMSPSGTNDVLIMQNLVPQKGPTGAIVFVGNGKKTVDVMEIRKRFDGLGIKTDWKRFDRINNLRNDIEHHFTSLQPDTIKGTISDTFVIIRDFIKNELNHDPKAELGDSAWDALLSVSEVFEKEREDCKQRLDSVDWESDSLGASASEVTCKACGSSLLVPCGKAREDGVECRSCGEAEHFESFAERALSDSLASSNYHSVKDGGDEC